MGLALLALLAIPATFVLSGFYLWHLNRAIKLLPAEAIALSPHRWSVKEIQDAGERIAETPLDTRPHLPPPTGRRYIVVGGAGFVGGWIVLHLLARGELPQNIRIIDLRRPSRKDMITGPAAEVDFVSADIRDIDSIRAALAAEWPTQTSSAGKGITVFHTVAGIRYYERHPSLVPRSSVLNVDGTKNTLKAAKEAGVDIFIFTSSASIPLCRTGFWVWPWQKHPKTLVQVVNDETRPASKPTRQNEFFSNYAYTKYLAEGLVCEADDPANGFRTGCLRPGNAIFGSGGDLNAGAYLVRGTNPSWVAPMIQSFTYVENVSYAHLLYEQRLLEANKLSGQAFLICDDGDPIAYSDLYLALSTLTSNRAQFPQLPASPMLILANMVETYYLLQERFPRVLPEITGDLANLQPSIFDLVTIHLKINDSRARLPPTDGGLGYSPPWTTLDGVCQLVSDHIRNDGEGEVHQRVSGGIGLGLKSTKAEATRRNVDTIETPATLKQR